MPPSLQPASDRMKKVPLCKVPKNRVEQTTWRIGALERDSTHREPNFRLLSLAERECSRHWQLSPLGIRQLALGRKPAEWAMSE